MVIKQAGGTPAAHASYLGICLFDERWPKFSSVAAACKGEPLLAGIILQARKVVIHRYLQAGAESH